MGKEKQLILYIGETKTHYEFQKGNVPSHWFYGAIEMEKSGHTVIWCQEESSILNDLKIIMSYKHNIVFIPNLNIRNHLLLLALSALNLYRKPIFAYLHREPTNKKGFRRYLYKFLLSGLSHTFFLSEKTMHETINAGIIKKGLCSIPGWGPDMEFFSKITVSDNGVFISTGKENRDFEIIIEAFKITGAPLRIITVPSNYTSHYEYLTEKCRDIPNIEVRIVKNDAANYPSLVKEMAEAKALVCPLRNDKLHYCVGLSTIADAEGLEKPLILTHNPYHDNRPHTDGFIQATTIEDWTTAIYAILNGHNNVSHNTSMSAAYQKMKTIMNL